MTTMGSFSTPREHIEFIRKNTFNIGQEPGPKDVFLHHAINYLSAELYTKDVHFLMELLQNAEDNEYLEGVDPSLEFVITSQDITATGAPATLLIFNNEKGFSPKNIESICALGCSTKKGNRKCGYIGEKGIGFKSVFLITARPYVFSNGYQICFSEDPCPECKVGFIVPRWVDENPTLSTIMEIYGSKASVPTTTFVLPLKPDKVKAVKQQLSSLHPEILLFLSKIKRLSVKEVNENPKLDSVSAISILKETEFSMRKNIDAESFILHLSADEKGECDENESSSYYMWRQRFPVTEKFKVEKRKDVTEWVITLAFPIGNHRLNRGGKSPGVYAYLPTEMVTGFPFMIQADFLLPSSRETILLDNPWNKGILSCVPTAFVNAIIALVKTKEDTPLSSLPPMFEYLPISGSSYREMDVIRESIKSKLANENIVPCESYMEQKFFRKPSEVGRLMSGFWNILENAKKEGINLKNISTHGKYVLASSFDRQEYDKILDFLGVAPMDNKWYTCCIQSSNLVLGVSEKLYLELLTFVAGKWCSNFTNTSMRYMPLIKYVDLDGVVSLFSIDDIKSEKLFYSQKWETISWLIDWNKEFRFPAKSFFLPRSVQEEILGTKWQTLVEWFRSTVGVKPVNVREYASLISNSIQCNKKLVVAFTHFLYHSQSKDYLSTNEANIRVTSLPVVDKYGQLRTKRKNDILVPASRSKWVSLLGSNLWEKAGYVELGNDYLNAGNFAGVYTPQNMLLPFLKKGLGASDIPDIAPPDEAIPTLSTSLTRDNTFLLLDWIKNLKRNHRGALPSKFINSIKEESWMNITMNGSSGVRAPSKSFFPSSSWGNLLQGVSLVDVPILDMSWYGDKINYYKDELKAIGLMFEPKEACEYFGKRVLSLVSSSALTREHVYSILKFIKFLRQNYFSPEDFVQNLKEGKWLRTSLGDRSPVGSVVYDQEWGATLGMCKIPFVSQDYYGDDILIYKSELELLGVVVGFNNNYEFVLDHLKSPAQISTQTNECGLFVLKCLSNIESADKFITFLKDKNFLKTSMGDKSPSESYLHDPEWGCLLHIFNSFSVIDEAFYGNQISFYKNELRNLGVVVDFEKATKAFTSVFKQQASMSSVGKGNVLSLLACLQKLNSTPSKVPSDLAKCIREVKWLRTRLGDHRAPKDCILFGSDWESIADICLLPFIDDSNVYYGKDIYKYEKELKEVGVIVRFKKGCKLVVSCLRFPCDPSIITPATAYALLECIRHLKEQKDEATFDTLLKKIGKNWLKTTFGYKSPNECILFNSSWTNFLAREDGPFIDEEFYGPKIFSYLKELKTIGVTVEVGNGCSLLATHLYFHSDFHCIVRIYNYLKKFMWKPESDVKKEIWVPKENGGGNWVDPVKCVLWDKDTLFAEQLNVLEKYYDSELLVFFANALGIRSYPCLDDYCKLWSGWERSHKKLSNKDCCAFWQFVVRNSSTGTLKFVSENLGKLPVDSGLDGALLVGKDDVFIADNLLLKDLFQKISRHLFVWFPKKSLYSPSRLGLLEIYSKIGVRKISESVKRDEILVAHGDLLKQVNPNEILIGKGLVTLILGFLASPSLYMEPEKRHEALKDLVGVTVFETFEPVSVSYKLSLSSGEILETEAKLMIHWERQSGKIIAKKMDKPCGIKSSIEYATCFSKVIAEGLLWENEAWIEPLTELIKVGFLLDFDEEAIEFLLKTKNLELFDEDHKFLSSVYSTS